MQITRLLVASVALLFTGASHAGPKEPDWQETLDRVSRSVVSLKVRAVRDFDTERAGSSTGTGFVIDSERGIILTNRHMVHEGPVISRAVFLNHEEVALEPIYRDPVHDFGFYRFDPSAIQHMEMEELQLSPEAAQVGVEIRVVGNDSGEKISILDGTIARLDRSAPNYGNNTYNDFNTFYLQAASNTSGGSSGSPVVDRSGRVVGLNAGGKSSAASAYYLPLHRVVRAVPYIQRGELPPRGTIQTTLRFTPYEALRQLGLSKSREEKARAFRPAGTGLLVVDSVVPGGPADGKLRSGDIVVEVNGEPVADFLAVEAVLDATVGAQVELGIERGGEAFSVELEVDDLHELTPYSFLEVGRGIFHELSYQQARNHHVEIGGVYVAQAGYSFSRAGLRSRSIITHVNGEPVPDLDAFQSAISAMKRGERALVRAWPISDPQRAYEVVYTADSGWHRTQRCVLQYSTGEWPCEAVSAPEGEVQPDSATVVFPTPSTKAGRYASNALVQVDFDIPYPTAGLKADSYRGIGIIADKEHGFVVADRDTVPVALGDIEITFAGQVRLPAQVIYLHPIHNFVVLRYDPALLEDTEVGEIQFRDEPVSVGETVWQVGLDSSSNLIEFKTTVAKVGPQWFGASKTPRFRETNIEAFSLQDYQGSLGGVIANRRGRPIAAWFSFMDQSQAEARFRAMPGHYIERVMNALRANEAVQYHALGAEFSAVKLADARERGLSAEYANTILSADPTHPVVMRVARTWGGTPAGSKLRNGDLVLEVNGQTFTRLRAMESWTTEKRLELVILRDGEIIEMGVDTYLVPGGGVDEIVQWAGLILHEPHLEVAFQAGEKKSGVYGSWLWYGSPAYSAGMRPTRRIIEVNDQPVSTMAEFIEAVRNLEHGESVRLTLEQLDGRVRVKTLRLDLKYWPTTHIYKDDGQWVLETVSAAGTPE